MTITVKDEDLSGRAEKAIRLYFQSKYVSIADIIEARVIKEVNLFNKRRPVYFSGLIELHFPERNYAGQPAGPLDTEKQVYLAFDAFQKNNYFVLVNEVQYIHLEQKVLLKEKTKIAFVKLLPFA